MPVALWKRVAVESAKGGIPIYEFVVAALVNEVTKSERTASTKP